MKKLLFIFCLLLICANYHSSVSAQSARSQCVTTKIGTPSGTPPPLPPGCIGGSGGDYHVPINPDDITSIMNEMGSYAGTFKFSWRHIDGTIIDHIEHPGLDIMTSVGEQVPVFAITDGEIIFTPGDPLACNDGYDGCMLQIKHTTDNLVSWYMHIIPSETYTRGQQIAKGEQIGVVNQWRPENDHLHLELRDQNTGENVNPRNYFPQFQQFPVNIRYEGSNVRQHSATRGIILLEDGLEWAEKFQYHPPCRYLGSNNARYCLAK